MTMERPPPATKPPAPRTGSFAGAPRQHGRPSAVATAVMPSNASAMTAPGGVVRRDGVGGMHGQRSAGQEAKDLAICPLDAGGPAIGPVRSDQNA